MRTIILMSLLGIVTACGRLPSAAIPSADDILWIPPEASSQRGVQTYADGSAELVFEIRDVLPDALSAQLSEQFALTGWAVVPGTERDWESWAGGGVLREGGRPNTPTLTWHGAWSKWGGRVDYSLDASVSDRSQRGSVRGYAQYSGVRRGKDERLH